MFELEILEFSKWLDTSGPWYKVAEFDVRKDCPLDKLGIGETG